MAIRDVYKQIEADREEEEWKSMGIDLLKGLAETEMGKKVAAFQQREGVQKSNINYKTAVKNAEHIKGERDTAYGHESGVIDFYVNKFTPMVKDEIARKYDEETFDEDRYAQLVRTEALRLAKKQKELLDTAYSSSLNLRGSDSYDAFVKVNDGYNQTLGGALGARIRRGFTGESRESLDNKAEKAIINSSYSENATALNEALDAYNRGFTWAESTKIAGIKELKRKGEKILGVVGKPEAVTYDTPGGKMTVMQDNEIYIDIHGVKRYRPVIFNEEKNAWLRGEKGLTTAEKTMVRGFGGESTEVTADVTRDIFGNRIDVIPVGTPNQNPPEFSELAPHLRAFRNTNTKSQEGENLSANLALRDSFQNTNVRGDDTKTLADIGYESILGVNGVLVAPEDVAADVQKRELTNAQSIVSALKRQILANYYDTAEHDANEDFAVKLAAQMFTNVGNNLLSGGTAGGAMGQTWGPFGTDTYYFDYERGTARYDDLKTLDVIDAIGTRQGSSPLITGGKDAVNKFLNRINKYNILEEFNDRSPQIRQYYLDRFEENKKNKDRFNFMHVSHSGGETVYERLEKIHKRQLAKGK